MLVAGGGHLEFTHEKLDGKMETVFFLQSYRVNISEKKIEFGMLSLRFPSDSVYEWVFLKT